MSQTLSPPAHTRIADEVRVWLIRRKITATQAAQKLGWGQKYLSRRLTGEVPFDVGEIVALADLLDTPVEQFFATTVNVSERKGIRKTLSSFLPLHLRLPVLSCA